MYSLKRKAIWQVIYEHIYHQPWGTQGYMELNRIKIPKYLLNSYPSDYKVKLYYKRFLKHGYLDQPITLKTKKLKNGEKIVFLNNGYIRFLIAANQLDEYRKIHNIMNYYDIPEELRYVPVKFKKE